MENQQIKQIVMQELPTIMQQDPEVQRLILQLSRQHFADKEETESRFDRVLDELRRDREENTRKWEENTRKWEEQNRKWEKNAHRWEENAHRWEENAHRWEEDTRKWEEDTRKWEEDTRKWEENTARLDRMLDAIERQAKEYRQSMGAIGARWGVYTEAAFRNALRGILQDSFGIEVLNVTEWDDTGAVFGRPDQIELDILITNGSVIACEIKSSMSIADMYTFERKVAFYEKLHQRKVSRRIVISPMIHERAQAVAQKLGIEVYSYADEVDPTVLDGV